mgnify:CR=1 FL=1
MTVGVAESTLRNLTVAGVWFPEGEFGLSSAKAMLAVCTFSFYFMKLFFEEPKTTNWEQSLQMLHPRNTLVALIIALASQLVELELVLL